MKLLFRLLLLCWVLAPWSSLKAEQFIIDEIEVVGIKKIAIGTVLNYLPVKNGEVFDIASAPELIRELYKTGFFEQISLYRRGDVLIIDVAERASIAEVNFDGNKEVNDEAMKDALKQIGMTKGKLYNPKLLEKLEQELQQLYYSLGKYSVRLETSAENLDEDRVKIDIQISEGAPARIRSINLIGNKAFGEEELLDEFKLEATDSAWFADDKYSSTKLSGDLETLKSWYLDQGYVRFEIESKQVTITPDKKDINIAINLKEGEQYTVDKVNLTGDLIVDEAELLALMNFREGDIFSRKHVTSTIQRMTDRLGDEGYAFARINTVPEINDENQTVSLLLVVEPGDKMSVRRIMFEGNTKTRDYVLRREMRQMEGEVYSTSKINRSKIRLQRLKYISSVDARLVRIADEPEQMDVLIKVEERFSGNFTIGLGYSQDQGALFNLGLTHDNIFGSGNNVAITFNNNKAQEQYEFSYTNPYYTPEGISRGFSVSYAKTDAAEANISNYLLDRIAVAVRYGIPLSEYNQINFGFGLEQNDVTLSPFTSNEVINYIVANNDAFAPGDTPPGDTYEMFFASMSFSTDSRNRLIFPDSGFLNVYGIEAYTGELDFYKLFYRHQSLFSLSPAVTFSFKARLGYGESYGDTTDLPFYEKYTAGGVRSVRGFEFNSLGPKDSRQQTYGGNFQFVTNTEVLFALDAIGGAESFRLGLYFDAGSVFETYDAFDEKELRTSTGLSAKWFTVIGPIELSYAVPLNKKTGDETQNFQFSLGAPF